MAIRKVAAYGDWSSPITLDAVTSKKLSLNSPRVCPTTGKAFYLESRDNGDSGISQSDPHGVKDVLPKEFSATNRVYEYGGSALDILPNGNVIFSNKDDSVKILDPNTSDVSDLVSSQHLRYSDFSCNGVSPWVLANEEDHTHDTPREIKNNVVAINSTTGEVKRLATGADFYYTPAFSPDGTKVAWLEWNFLEMPFDAARLYWADFNTDGSVSNVELLAGDKREGVTEPRFGPDGSLFYGREAGNYRKLVRISPRSREPVEIKLEGLEEAEFGELRWKQGARTFAPLSERWLVASAATNGVSRLIAIDLSTNSWHYIAGQDSVSTVKNDAMTRFDDETVLVICSGETSPATLRKISIQQSTVSQVIQKSIEDSYPPGIISIPKAVSIPSRKSPSQQIHGFLWMPKNDEFVAPEGALPPLIISSHGGPTGVSSPGLDARTQYFTSRGYALLMLNHRGSTGHGREYRQSLFGKWGQYDADDAADFADYFTAAGIIKPGAVGITGLSAGGFNTLQCLVRYPKTFAGGVCASGISELSNFDKETHKLESDYTSALVAPDGANEEEKVKALRKYSPLYSAQNVESPLLLVHAIGDTVVPISQARDMAKALEDRGDAVKLVEIAHENHAIAKPHSSRIWLDEEEAWWRKTLL